LRARHRELRQADYRQRGSVVFQTTDIHDVIQEVKSLLTEQHEFRTLDPITPIYNDLLEKCEAKVGADFGRHYGAANKEMKRLANLILALDMNVVITAHAKTEYGQNLSPANAASEPAPRKRRTKTADLPFSEKQEFEEADIPF
jgi:hypothetical protein